MCVDVPEIHLSPVQLCVSIEEQSQSKLHAVSPLQLWPESVEIQTVADLTLQHGLTEGGADWLPELRGCPAQGGQRVSELTEGDEGGGGERGLAGLGEDVRRVVHLSRHPLVT